MFFVNFQVHSSQMVQAQGPLAMYETLHNKRCLLVGQGPLGGIAGEYPKQPSEFQLIL